MGECKSYMKNIWKIWSTLSHFVINLCEKAQKICVQTAPRPIWQISNIHFVPQFPVSKKYHFSFYLIRIQISFKWPLTLPTARLLLPLCFYIQQQNLWVHNFFLQIILILWNEPIVQWLVDVNKWIPRSQSNSLSKRK